MPFGFGSKKKEEPKPAPAPQASTNYSPPGGQKPAAAAPANGGADDLFGGVQTVTRRRGKSRKGGDGIDDSASVMSEAKTEKSDQNAGKAVEEKSQAPSNDDSSPGDKKPFSAPKWNFGGEDDGESFAEVEDAETQALRARLERFYTKYNPQKLTKLDDTIKAYKGKEEKLFASLEQKYGPEPGKDISAAEDNAAASGDANGGWGTSEQGDGAKEGGGSAWGDGGGDAWGSTEDTTKAGETGGWGDSGGFGDAKDEGGSGGFGFGEDAGKKEGEEDATKASGWGDSGGFNATEGETAETSAWGDAKPDGDGEAGGWGTTAAEGDSAEGAFGFDSEAKAGDGWGGDATNDDSAPAVAAAETSSSSSEEEGDVPLWEQHRREIVSAASYLTEKQDDVAKVVADLADSINARHKAQKEATQKEAAMDAAIARDDFEEASRLDEELQAVKKEIAAADDRCSSLPQAIAEEEQGLESAFLDLASLAEQQGQSLKNNLSDEERKVDKYITEATSKVDQTSDRIAADLDKATRTKNNVEQEVVNLEQRRNKIIEKNEQATAAPRKHRDELAATKREVEDEIRQLEETLAKKRRLLAEKKMELGDVEEKLSFMMRDHEESLKDLDEQTSEEKKKLEKAQSTVDNLTAQEEKVNREKSDLSAEAERLNNQLASQREKMRTSADVADSIRQTGLETLQEYYSKTLKQVLVQRQQGIGYLCASPESFPELAKVSNALSALEIEIQQETSLQSTATLRLQEIAKSLPVLEAAKKSAALAKQFKEASAKTAEIKALNEEKVNVEKDLETSTKKSSGLRQSEADLIAQKKVEEKKIAKEMEGFVLGYYNLLKQAIAKAPTGTGVQKWVNTLSTDAEAHEADVFADATKNLLKVLEEECRATPVKLDRAGSAGASAANSPARQHQDPFPPNGGADPVEEATKSASPTQGEAPAEEEEEEPVEDSAPTKTVAEIEEEIAKLEGDIESAMEVEDFDQCDLCQNAIDDLKAQLAKLQGE